MPSAIELLDDIEAVAEKHGLQRVEVQQRPLGHGSVSALYQRGLRLHSVVGRRYGSSA